MRAKKNKKATRFRLPPASLLVLLCGVLITLLATNAAVEREYARQQAELTLIAQRARAAITERFVQYKTLVRSSQAIFAASAQVERAEWQSFARMLRVGEQYPGLQGLMYFAWVPASQLPGFLQVTRNDGAPDFTIYPPGSRDYYCPLTFYTRAAGSVVDPSDLGMDICTSSRPYTVLSAIRDSGELMLSMPVNFTENQGPTQPGFLLLAPIYAAGMSLDTPGARHTALQGWVGTMLLTEPLLADVLPPDQDVIWQVFDTTNATEETLVFSNGTPTLTTGNVVRETAQLTSNQRTWTLRFERHFNLSSLPLVIGISGCIISLLLFLLLVAWARTRREALNLAEDMTQALRESEQLLSSITDNIFEGIYRGVPERGLIYVNQSLAHMFGFSSPDQMLATTSTRFYADAARRDELQALMTRQGFYKNEEVEYVRHDGSRFFGLNNAVGTFDEDGKLLYWDGAIYDITDRKLAEEKVHYLAHFDALTNLPNRILLRQNIEQAIRGAVRDKRLFALLFVDLDHFKTVNDSLGHDLGDQLLQEVARRLAEAVRVQDTVSRQGGDEFIVLAVGVADTQAAVLVANKLTEAISRPYDISGHQLHITPSIGLVLYPQHGEDIDTLIRNADAAMYYAKESGRNNYRFFNRELSVGAINRLTLETSLRRALENNEFVLHYQPQLDLRDGRITGFEALLRWQHPERGLLSPGEFISVAEQSGQIIGIGTWVLAEACRQARSWQQAGLPPVVMSVNLSAIQFRRGRVDTTVATALRESGLDAHYLELELTESAIMQDSRVTLQVLGRLDALGVRLAVDDFGTGYSSLNYLKRFPVDRLKIDQSFIRDLAEDGDDAAIVTAIIGMARALKLNVLAEGVETEAQLEFLARQNCDAMQGYLFSKAVPPDQAAALLQEDRRLEVPRQAARQKKQSGM